MANKFLSAFNAHGFAQFGYNVSEAKVTIAKPIEAKNFKVKSIKRLVKRTPLPAPKACNKQIVRQCGCKRKKHK